MKLPLLLLALVAFLQAPSAVAQDVVKIRLAHSLSTTEPDSLHVAKILLTLPQTKTALKR